MGIRIVTDSTAEISQQQAQQLGISVVPLNSVFPDREYLDGIDLSKEEFYQMLAAAEELPKTSQPSPYAFEQVYREARDAGDDEIIVICISSVLSGTYQSAEIARESVGGKIWVIDSESATLGLNILVRRALDLRDSGMSAEQIVQAIEAEKQRLRIFAAIDTLDYLHKGGRLSTTSKIAGTLLNVKPLISLVGGELKSIGKCRGMKTASSEVYSFVEKDGGIDFSMPIALGYTGDIDRFAHFEEISTPHLAAMGEQKPAIVSIGAVIGTHIGPGAVAIAYFSKAGTPDAPSPH
ncbi:MAG: DegV family protein [Coriobacteriia bacterium]|nr:DegV family protein [Coriobacteriia bacterium]